MKKVATATATLLRPLFSQPSNSLSLIYHHRHLSTNNKSDDKEWNDAWETAWLPDDDTTTTNTPAPWDSSDATNIDAVDDSDTKAFIEDMNQNWHHRRNKHPNKNNIIDAQINNNDDSKEGEVKVEDDYRLKKQRIHAGLWSQQIHQLHESKLGGANDDDIDNLLHSCSELFDSGGNDPKVPSSSEFKNKPDGWETTSKPEDGNVWEMSQREEDVLLQEFERRSAFCKFQIASFIKTHIFSRRRPIDGWKYMIEVIGPNAKKGKGSVSRIPGLADPATQPFTEERTPVSGGRLTSRRAR